MAFNPQRSWAVTYNQMWNLSMRDPLPRTNNKYDAQNHYAGYAGGGYGNSGSKMFNNTSNKRNKSDYCWNFNKGVPCKFGAKCKLLSGANIAIPQHMVCMPVTNCKRKELEMLVVHKIVITIIIIVDKILPSSNLE